MQKTRRSVAAFTDEYELRLLKALDKVAKARGMSRNRLIALIIKQFIKQNV